MRDLTVLNRRARTHSTRSSCENSHYQIVLREFTVLSVLQRLHGNFAETPQRLCRDSMKILQRTCRDSTWAPQRPCRLHIDSAETPWRLYRNSTEILQKIPEILRRLQRFYRDSLETLTESCNGSTVKLLGYVAGIILFLCGACRVHQVIGADTSMFQVRS